MEDFINRYKTIFGTKVKKELPEEMTMKEKCEKIFKRADEEIKLKTDKWQIGLTKVFMKEETR